MCQNIEVSICRYFSEGEAQFVWVFGSSTGSVILRSCGFDGVECVGSGDWVKFV